MRRVAIGEIGVPRCIQVLDDTAHGLRTGGDFMQADDFEIVTTIATVRSGSPLCCQNMDYALNKDNGHDCFVAVCM